MADSLVDWQSDEDLARQDTSAALHHMLLPVAIGASLLLHGAIIGALLLFADDEYIPPLLTSVSINLVPANPLTVVPAPLPEIASPIPAPGLPPDNSAPEPANTVPEAIVPARNPAPATMQDLAVPPRILTEPVVEPARPAIALPSMESVQRATQSVGAAQDSRSWLFECNPLQEEDGLHTCDKRGATDYQAVERNPVYQALNPTREYSRSARSVRSVYQNSGVIAGALDSNAIPAELRDYVLEELEAGTSLYTNNGTSNAANMRRLTDDSAAAKQAERVLGDAWVRGRAVELQQRKVHGNQ